MFAVLMRREALPAKISEFCPCAAGMGAIEKSAIKRTAAR
jgi:hypothetical protein